MDLNEKGIEAAWEAIVPFASGRNKDAIVHAAIRAYLSAAGTADVAGLVERMMDGPDGTYWPSRLLEEAATALSAMAAENERLRNRVVGLENDIRIGFSNIDRETTRADAAEAEIARLRDAIAEKDKALEPKGRVKVPEGQTPLDDNLGHRLLDVIAEGQKARETGTYSPYHGHSLEHCLHATGWVQRDLRMALDAARRAHGGQADG